MAIYNSNGLDLDFSMTKAELNIPTKLALKGQLFEEPSYIFENIKQDMLEKDRIQFCQRFRYYNLPPELRGEDIENIIYFHGTVAFFYMKEIDEFFVLPISFASNKTSNPVNARGQYLYARPIPFRGTDQLMKEKPKSYKMLEQYLSSIEKKICYKTPLVEDIKEALEYYFDSAVLISDQTSAQPCICTPRSKHAPAYVENIINTLIQIDALQVNTTGFSLYNTDTEASMINLKTQLNLINKQRRKGALTGVTNSTLTTPTQFQSTSTGSMVDMLNLYQAHENIRLSSMGLSNDGVVQKQQYKNILQQELSAADVRNIFNNALAQRVNAFSIINQIWGLDIVIGAYKTDEEIIEENFERQQGMSNEGDYNA